jgi:uncharacterized protein (TIGR00369 family)
MDKTLLEKYNEYNHFGRLLGMHFKVIEDGKVEYTIKTTKDHLATPVSAHGGLIAALVDAALGVAALSAVYKDQKVVSTIEYKLNFLSPVSEGDELIALANVDQRGKRILVVSCEIVNATKDKCLVAKALGTFNAYPAEKAGY